MANDFNAQALADAITAGIAATQPQRAPSFAEYIQRPGKREPRLARPVFQNGAPIQIKGVSDATIRNLENLQPGEYLGGLVKVTVKGREPNEQVHITYPCATVDDRMRIYSLVSSFSDMVAKIAREQREAAKL